MKQPKEFSVSSIKEVSKSFPETFYGDEGFVSFKTEKITDYFGSNGEPLRFASISIALCVSGELKSEVNLVDQTLAAGDFEFFLPGTIYRLESMTPDCSIVGISFSPFYVHELFPGDSSSVFFRLNHNRKINLEAKDQSYFKDLAKLYLKSLKLYGEQSKLVRNVAVCILQFAIHVLSHYETSCEKTQARVDELSVNFFSILNETKGAERSVGYYSNRLGVGNHYLSVAVKETTGVSIKSLIDKAAITETKVLLRLSNIPINELALKMGFPNSSSFCKFFKENAGISPLQYRKKWK